MSKEIKCISCQSVMNKTFDEVGRIAWECPSCGMTMEIVDKVKG